MANMRNEPVKMSLGSTLKLFPRVSYFPMPLRDIVISHEPRKGDRGQRRRSCNTHSNVPWLQLNSPL